MNLITFSFSEKGSPIFLNQEPYQQVGTMYLMKAGDNSIIGITLDDKMFKITARGNGAVKRPRKAKAVEAAEAPKRRSRKVKAEVAEVTPKRRGRKPAQTKEKPGKRTRKKKEEAQEAAK